MSKALKLIRDNPDLLVKFVQGLSLIEQSRVFDVLRDRAGVRILDNGSDVQKSAAEAHRSMGFNQALNELVNFKEIFIEGASEVVPSILPTYGAVERAFRSDDLLPEEVDAIRTNTKPKYTNLTTAKGSDVNSQALFKRNP